ncbi:MAG: DUF3098 domain-containing protein [Bacteroidales bacterium]|nr:DUF3098 domain-containing protein [Bacteroidales bacterium]MBD5190946.1 DUF3098 domain-containing protein [Bacteroidales bacterium]MBD5208541.1 DUF3098 domain-containing protein [Bacteroidales bacterium]MDE6084255.1 DUF3098 domain-containing protein [Muribaculaceae bacterium]
MIHSSIEKHDVTDKSDITKIPSDRKPFGKINYIMMLICLAMIVVGFILMSGPGSSAETGFNPDIFSTRRIVVGPTISFLGFLFMAFAIIYTPKKKR